MPHPGHFICAHYCRFHLNTCVGSFIVSTVGEMWWDPEVRRLLGPQRDPVWWEANKDLKGDNFDAVWLKRFGYEEVGLGRKYETMVFPAKKAEDEGAGCCPYRIDVTAGEVDMDGYNDPAEARRGHMAMCLKWSRRG